MSYKRAGDAMDEVIGQMVDKHLGKPKADPPSRKVHVGVGGTGQIYFVEAEGADLVKIGYTSRTVWRRIGEWGALSPWPLRVLCQVPGSEEGEQHIHRRLAPIRVSQPFVGATGEWFRLTPKLRRWILQRARQRREGPDDEATIERLENELRGAASNREAGETGIDDDRIRALRERIAALKERRQ